MQTCYFGNQVCACFHERLKNVHVLELPMFERHTGKYMFELFNTLYIILEIKVTGRHRCVVARPLTPNPN
jgi:hypothetical protein